MAAFNLGNAYFMAKNFTEAQAAFEQYLNKYADDDPYYVTSAMAGIAGSIAGLGDARGAADKYREAAETFPEFTLAAQYYLRALEYYIKAGEMESAKVIFAKISKEYEDTPYYMDGARLAAEHNIKL
jgi:tetratricopeptide (TPR) repeat protein